jgi:hypothetical protein
MHTITDPAQDALIPPHCEQFVKANPEAFPSIASFRWYVHRNRAALTDAGAILIHRGRMHVDPACFARVMRSIAAQRAQAHASASAG